MVKSIQLRNTEVLKLSAIIFWVNFLIKSFVLENFWVRKKCLSPKKGLASKIFLGTGII